MENDLDLGQCDNAVSAIIQFCDEHNVERPTWLSKPYYDDLPRVNSHLTEHPIEIKNERPVKLMIWIIETLESQWNCLHMYSDEKPPRSIFTFETKEDSVHFALKWRNE